MDIASALLFAFIGGIILNLMPCVFPVLSIKALALVEIPRENRRLARHSGLLYTAGILAAFVAVGGALLGLRAAGHAAGWGFQLQNPAINLGLGLLMLAMGLNLLGVFEIGGRLIGAGQALTGGGERRAAFFTGLLAVLVATPCTAPFMAGALGYALVQPAGTAVAVFLSLGLGLAAPYLLISLVPAFGRMLPRPGPWMAAFRNVLAFPMFATAVWLFWIIGKQLGVNAMAVGLVAALCFGFALWTYGRGANAARPWAWRATAVAALAATLVAGANVDGKETSADHQAQPAIDPESHAGTLGLLQLERFTPERVVGYIESRQPVFVYFTADWCVNCKVNERIALSTDQVGQAFAQRGIKVVVGDWTNEDAVITEWLQRHGRAGVPLYLYFPRGSSLDSAAILPQVLLPEIVIEAIDRANADQDLLSSLNNLTVGARLPNVSARRLDGMREDFAAYQGQTVLLDIWATWCGPCLEALPKLRELQSDLSAGLFQVLSISVDDRLETVVDFQAAEPMPWANWHIGPHSPILDTWAVRGFPTYLLVDDAGAIRARTHKLDSSFTDLIRKTACGDKALMGDRLTC